MAPEFRKNEYSILRDKIKKIENIISSDIEDFLSKNKVEYLNKYKLDNIEFDYYLPKIRTCVDFEGKHNLKVRLDYCEENYLDLIIIKYEQENIVYEILWENLKSRI